MARGNESIERRVVRQLLKTENKRGWTEITVVDWVVGPKKYRQLEKREFFAAEDGSTKMGKAKGFNRADFALILGKAREIMELLGGSGGEGATPPQNESSGVSEASAAPPPGRPDPF